MLNTFLPLFVFAAITIAFLLLVIGSSIFLGPKKHSDTKDKPFECGTVGSGSVTQRHGVRFYLVAVIFILFDVEVVFFYPWVVNLKTLGWYGLTAVFPFFLLMVVGLAYEWKRGVLDWS